MHCFPFLGTIILPPFAGISKLVCHMFIQSLAKTERGNVLMDSITKSHLLALADPREDM